MVSEFDNVDAVLARAYRLRSMDGYRDIIDDLLRGNTNMALTRKDGRLVVDQDMIYTAMEFLEQVYVKTLEAQGFWRSDVAFLRRLIDVLCKYLPWTDDGLLACRTPKVTEGVGNDC